MSHWYAIYDTQVNIDAQHSDGYEYYLWYDSDAQTAMACPVFYPDDSVSVGRRGFLGIHLFDAVEISLNPSSFSVPQYNYLFGGE